MRLKRARVRVVRCCRTRQQRQDDDEQKKQPASSAYVPSAALSAFAIASGRAVQRPSRPPTAPPRGESPVLYKQYTDKKSNPVDSEQAVASSSGATGEWEQVRGDGDGEKEKYAEDVAVMGLGTTTFPSQPFASFQFSLAAQGETHAKIAMQNVKTDEQWESNLMELSEFVTAENRIPMATLGEYVKCFADSLKAKKNDNAPRPDLVPAASTTTTTDRNDMRLEITLQVRVLSQQWLAKYEFLLLGVEKKPEEEEEEEEKPEQEQADGVIAAIQKQLQAQEVEIANLKDQVIALQKAENNTISVKEEKGKCGVYFRATAFSTAERDEEIDWVAQRTCEEYFKVKEDASAINNAIEFVKPGLFTVLAVAHHSNCENDTAAFQLLINGKCVQSCFASSPNGSRQSSSLMHFVHANVGDKLSVVYKGSGSCETESCLEANLVE